MYDILLLLFCYCYIVIIVYELLFTNCYYNWWRRQYGGTYVILATVTLIVMESGVVWYSNVARYHSNNSFDTLCRSPSLVCIINECNSPPPVVVEILAIAERFKSVKEPYTEPLQALWQELLLYWLRGGYI